MDREKSEIVLGIFILVLSLLMWRMTHVFIAWAIFFLPGAGFTFHGIYLRLRD